MFLVNAANDIHLKLMDHIFKTLFLTQSIFHKLIGDYDN